jgi:hypothetical protein
VPCSSRGRWSLCRRERRVQRPQPGPGKGERLRVRACLGGWLQRGMRTLEGAEDSGANIVA